MKRPHTKRTILVQTLYIVADGTQKGTNKYIHKQYAIKKENTRLHLFEVDVYQCPQAGLNYRPSAY
jgi:hypothetical protein